MTHEEMLEHLNKGVVFNPPRRHYKPKPRQEDHPFHSAIFTPEEKRNHFLVRCGDYSPYKKRFK